MPKQISAMKKHSVRGSRTGRPIMALLDLLGRRWTLRILWELRGVADIAGIARGLLTSLAYRAAGAIVGVAASGSGRTAAGLRLSPALQSEKNYWRTFCRCIALPRDGAKAIVSTDTTATLGVAVPPQVKGWPPGRASATKLGTRDSQGRFSKDNFKSVQK